MSDQQPPPDPQQPDPHQPGQQPGPQQPGQQPPWPPQPGQYPPQYGQAGYGYGTHPSPYGVHPITGVPYSDKSKLAAALLQILLPLGIGRFYIGDTGIGVAQLLVTIFTCGIGALWPFIDGIVMLAGDPVDSEGRPLRPN